MRNASRSPQAVSAVIETQRRAMETVEVAARIEALENAGPRWRPTTCFAKLQNHQPQIDQEQRQEMIASIEQWLVELGYPAPTDRAHAPLSRGHTGMLAEKRSAPRGQLARAKSVFPQDCSLQAAKVDVAAVAALVIR